jgi:hypothetical protein
MQIQPLTPQSLTVSTRAAQLLGSIAALIFVPLALYALGSGQIPSALLFLVFAIGGIYILVFAQGAIEMDAEAISLKQRGQIDRIRWDEVSLIEKAGDTLIFNGQDKCLVVIEPMWWQGRDKASMMKLLSDQIRQRELPVRSNLLATFRRSRNVRVS